MAHSESRSSAPTIADVARVAGVSYATAERVVNKRGKVADKSIRRVQEAVQTLGYTRNLAAANLSQKRRYRLLFLLPDGRNPFFDGLKAALTHPTGPRDLRQIETSVVAVRAFDPDALINALDAIEPEATDSVAVIAIDDARVREAVIRLQGRGVATVALISGLGVANLPYIGIDNRVAGATAGRLIGMAAGGDGGVVLPVIGSLAAADHAARLDGLQDVIGQGYPHLRIASPLETRDNADDLSRQVADTLERENVAAIYSVGAGNAGLASALADRKKRPFTVVHELVPETRRALMAGLFDAVIDQQPAREVSQAITTMTHLIDGLALPDHDPIQPMIYLPENCPPDLKDLT